MRICPKTRLANVRFGSKADMCAAKRNVRFTPNSDRESGHRQTVMSALPLKADMCGAAGDVRYGPIADTANLLDDFVRTSENCWRYYEAECFSGFKIDH